MKDNSVDRFEWLRLGGVAVALVALPLLLAACLYTIERQKGITKYKKALEVNLNKPDTMNLKQVRAGLGQWMVGYEELQVPTSYTNIYVQVEGILAAANALTERFPSMLAPEFERDLGLLQKRMEALPPISADLYAERNPWFSGFILFVLIGGLKFGGLYLLLFGLIVGMIWLLEIWGAKATTTTSSANITSSSGAGYGGSDEYPPHPEMYGGCWGPHPPDCPPRFPWWR